MTSNNQRRLLLLLNECLNHIKAEVLNGRDVGVGVHGWSERQRDLVTGYCKAIQYLIMISVASTCVMQA